MQDDFTEWSLVDWCQLVSFCIDLKNEMLNEKALSNEDLAKKMDDITQKMILDNRLLCEKIIAQNEKIIAQNEAILKQNQAIVERTKT